MKAQIFIILGCFLWTEATAQLPGVPGILDPASHPQQESASGITYLINETFDATGYDSGTWTESNTSEIKEDYATAPSPLSGTQSVYFDVTASRTLDSPAFAAQNTAWVSFLLHNDEATLPGAQRAFFAFKDSVGGTSQVVVSSETDGDITVACGSATQRSTASITTNVTYRFWVSYTKGTGANGQASVYWVTPPTDPKGSAKATVSTGTSTGQAASVRFVGMTDMEWHLDDVKISASEIQ